MSYKKDSYLFKENKDKPLSIKLVVFLILMKVSLIVALVAAIKKDTSSNTQKDTVESTIVDSAVYPLEQEGELDTLTLGDSIKSFIKELNLAHPEIVYAQARLESGNFKSDLFKNHSNLFGMKKAWKRPQIYDYVTDSGFIGHSNGNWRQSVLDYALYQSYFLSNKSRSEYMNFLKRSYAEDNSYIEQLRVIIKSDTYEDRTE